MTSRRWWDPLPIPLWGCSRPKERRRCLEKLEAQIVELVRSRLAGEGYPEICKRLEINARRAHMLYHKASKQLQTCVERELS